MSADDDLCVDAAPVVLADRGDRLIVHWDEGAVDDPRVFAVVWFGLQRTGQDRHQVMDYPIDGRLAGCKQCGQRPGRQVGGKPSVSVGDGFMITMAAASTDTTAVISGDAVLSRRRGKSKAPNFTYDGPVSVIRLELDVSDPVVRRRVEAQWAAVFRLRRALQRDAAARCRAYWAAHRERDCDPKAVRERLGLSRKAIEAAA